MTYAKWIKFLETLPKDKFYPARYMYQRLGDVKYKKIWEKYHAHIDSADNL